MRTSARRHGPGIAVLIIALAIVAVLAGCGDKGDTSKGGPVITKVQLERQARAQPAGPGGPGGGPGGPGGPPGGGGASQTGPSAPSEIHEAEPPTAEQLALVDEAVTILRAMLTRDVPPPPPGEQADEDEQGAAESAGPPTGGPGEGPGGPRAARPSRSPDYRIAQADAGPPPEGPAGPDAAVSGPGAPGGGPMDISGAAPSAAGGAPGSGGAGEQATAIALALTIKDVCQKTRGIQMNDQKWFHEYWFFTAKTFIDRGILVSKSDLPFATTSVGNAPSGARPDTVYARFLDFPTIQLASAAQTKSDWEGYLWHWAMRKMFECENQAQLEFTGKYVAAARTALAAIHGICKHGLLMHDVDRTKLGRLTAPTIDHVANCIQLSFGNKNYDPAEVKRDETKRSRLMVEVFDNYLMLGHNWHWERSRNTAYLSRVSNNLPSYTCDSCGRKMTREHQMWRCPRCGKAARPAVPGTVESVETHECLECGYEDQYRTWGMRCPACGELTIGHRLRRDWNSPTFERSRQGLLNAQHAHKLLETVFAEDSVLPTGADRQAYEAWLAASPVPDWIPDVHHMELLAHQGRLLGGSLPSDHQPQTD